MSQRADNDMDGNLTDFLNVLPPDRRLKLKQWANAFVQKYSPVTLTSVEEQIVNEFKEILVANQIANNPSISEQFGWISNLGASLIATGNFPTVNMFSRFARPAQNRIMWGLRNLGFTSEEISVVVNLSTATVARRVCKVVKKINVLNRGEYHGV